MILKITKRGKLLFVLGGLVVLISTGVIWIVAFYEPPGHEVAFRLDFVWQTNNGATNLVVFRLTSLDRKHNYALLTPGAISTPLPRNSFAPSLVFFEALPNPAYGPWTFPPLPPATWATNFVPTPFKGQVEFAIVAPTNDVWRLNMQISRPLSRMEALTWKSERAWESLKARKFSAIPGAWSGPWSVTLNYSTWSAPLTNKPTVNNEMTHAVP